MKDNTFKYIFFVIVVLMIALAVYLLYSDKNESQANIQEEQKEINMIKEFNIGITNYDNINPILSNNRDIQYIDKLIFDSLLTVSYDFKIENLLAKEFSKINPTTYIVKLRDDVYWHDNTKFTAKDVIFTINNLINSNVNSIYKENTKNISEVQEIDEYTIKILLKEETPFFEYMMCFPIVASHAYEEKTFNSKTENPIGTGKYKITKIENGNIELQIANSKSSTKITKINLILKNSSKELYSALTKKEVDYIITDNILYEEYIGTMGYNINQSNGREFDYLVLNNNDKVLGKPEVRLALSYAIDRNAINYKVYNNKYITSDFPLDYGSYLENPEQTKFEYNTNKAKSILVEYGWTYKNKIWQKSGNVLQFNLVVNKNNEKRLLVAEEIKEQLKEIGIVVNIIKVNNYMYNNYVKNKNYDIILTGNIVSTSPNIETYFGDNNLFVFNNEQIKSILLEVKNINDIDLLKQKYSEIQKIYKEQVPFISLYTNSLFVISSTSLKGDLSHNWYNLFYNIDNWYKVQE